MKRGFLPFILFAHSLSLLLPSSLSAAVLPFSKELAAVMKPHLQGASTLTKIVVRNEPMKPKVITLQVLSQGQQDGVLSEEPPLLMASQNWDGTYSISYRAQEGEGVWVRSWILKRTGVRGDFRFSLERVKLAFRSSSQSSRPLFTIRDYGAALSKPRRLSITFVNSFSGEPTSTFENKKPRWSKEAKKYLLPFYGLAQLPSIKNVIFEDPGEDDEPPEEIFLFAKRRDSFFMRFSSPFSFLEAFALGVSLCY